MLLYLLSPRDPLHFHPDIVRVLAEGDHSLTRSVSMRFQGSHRLEKYLNLEGFLEKSLKNKSALKSTGKSLKGLEKSLNSSIFCRT